MNVDIRHESWWGSIGLFVAWAATGLLAVIDGLYIRDAALNIAGLIQLEQYKIYRQKGGIGLDFSTGFLVTVFDMVLMLVLCIGMVVAVVAIEYYYRKGRPKGLLLKRIGIVFGIEIAIIVVSILIRMI